MMTDRVVQAESNVVPFPGHASAPEPEQPERRRRTFGKVRLLPSGRFQASYVVNGERHLAPVTFLTKGDAASWLDMRHAELLEYRWRPAPPPIPDSLSFADYAAEWLARRELKPRTRSEYRKMLAGLLSSFGHVEIRDITSADVRAWFDSLDPAKRTARAHAYSLLRAIFATAASEEKISANPCRIRAAGVAKRTRKVRPATLAELIAIANGMPERYRAMVLVAAWCALRFGELTELRRKDVDLDARVIHVSRAVSWPTAHTPVVGTPKSEAGVRTIAIPPHIVAPLAAHIERYSQPGPDGLLFPNTEGQHMHHGSLYKVFRPARAKAGRPDLRWHDLRHTGATMAARSGATLAELMNRLGHSTVAAALVYQHAADDRDQQIAERLSRMAQEEL
jgi:integrase